MAFQLQNTLQLLEQSGFAGVTINDNAAPAANVIYTSLKSGQGGSTPPATTTSVGTIQLAGVLTGTATSPQLAPGSISGSSLAPGSITSTQLAPGSINSSQIANGAIGLIQLAALSGPSKLLGSNSSGPNVTNVSLDPSLQMSPSGVLSVNPSSVTVAPATTTSLGTIQLAGVLTGTATSPQLAAGSVGASQLASGAVTSSSIAPGSITSSSLAPDSITSSQLASDSVGTSELAPLPAPSELLGSSSTSSNATNITLGTGLSMSGSVLSVNASTAIPPATSSSLGTIQLAGALTGSATAPSLATDSVGATQIAAASVGATELGANVVGNSQLAALSGPSQLIGSESGSSAATNIVLGSGLTMTGNTLNSILSAIPIPVSEGGTGVTSISSGDIVLGNGTNAITTTSSIPATQVTPNLVGSVNGVLPSSAGGNVNVVIGSVTTGVLSAQPAQPQPNGNIYVVSGDPTPANNGITFISNGTTWNEVTNNIASTDARYVQLAGSTMSTNANLVFPSTSNITLNQTTFASTDAVTAQYVASQIATGSTPAATTTSLGTIQLAGSLSGTATSPSIASGVVTQTNMASNSIGSAQIIDGSVGTAQLGANVVGIGQLAPLSANSELLGSNSLSPNVTNISLGTGLNMSSGGVLSVDASTAIPAATSSTLGTIQLAGALSGSATSPTLATGSVGSTQIVNNSVGTGQLAALSGTSQLIGSNSSSSTATNITLGTGLSMSSGGVLSATAVTPAPATSTTLGTIQLAGSLSGTATAPTIANNAVGATQLANGAVGINQLAPLAATSQLLGSSSTSNTPTNITLGPSMSIIASQLNSGISFVSGQNPNVTAPTDRPATSNVLYVGTDGSVWIYQQSSTSYITVSGAQSGTQLYLSSNTNITIPSGSNSKFPVSDLAIFVANNQTIRASYYLRYQTVSSAWAPSFAFTGLNAATDVLMGSGWWAQNTGNSTTVTMYSFCGSQASTVINTFDSNVPSVLAGGSNTGPTFNATNNFTTCTLEIEYQNLSGSTVSLVVQFARDINDTSYAIRLTGGSVAYYLH